MMKIKDFDLLKESIEFFNLKAEDDESTMMKKVEEKFNLTFETMRTQIGEWTKEHAAELVVDMPYIAPNNDYSKLIDEKEPMELFLKEEAFKQEYWLWDKIILDKHDSGMFKVFFANNSVDDGEILKGFAFISKSGQLRHAFASVEP